MALGLSHLPRPHIQPARHARHSLRKLSYPLLRLLRRLRLLKGKPSLLDLPVEILEEIFLLACIDGGRTACSLALVSKWVNATSRVARFHSVSLFHDGCGCLVRRLLSSYDDGCRQADEEKAIRPRIRHLVVFTEPHTVGTANFIGDPVDSLREHMARQEYSCCPAKPALGVKFEQGVYVCETDRDDAAKAALQTLIQSYVKSVQELLAKVANDVETLVLLRHTWRHELPVLRVQAAGFPKLRDFWLFREACVEFALDPQRPKGPLFPSLRRLHAIEPDYTSFERYAHDAPALETLCVRHLPFWLTFNPVWVQSLAEIAAKHPHWPRLRPIHILIDGPLVCPSPSPDRFFERQRDDYHKTAQRVYDVLCRARTRIVFVPYFLPALESKASRADRWKTSEALLRRDWLARVSQSSATDSELDGIYTRDCWARYEGDGQADDPALKLVMSGRFGPELQKIYIPPLVQRYNPASRSVRGANA